MLRFSDLRYGLGLGAILLAAAGCSSDANEPSALTRADVVGRWRGVSAVLVDNADAAHRFDLLPAPSTLVVHFHADSTFADTVDNLATHNRASVGEWRLESGTLYRRGVTGTYWLSDTALAVQLHRDTLVGTNPGARWCESDTPGGPLSCIAATYRLVLVKEGVPGA